MRLELMTFIAGGAIVLDALRKRNVLPAEPWFYAAPFFETPYERAPWRENEAHSNDVRHMVEGALKASEDYGGAVKPLQEHRKQWTDSVGKHIRRMWKDRTAFEVRSDQDAALAIMFELAQCLEEDERGRVKEELKELTKKRSRAPRVPALESPQSQPFIQPLANASDKLRRTEDKYRHDFASLVKVVERAGSISRAQLLEHAATARRLSEEISKLELTEPPDAIPYVFAPGSGFGPPLPPGVKAYIIKDSDVNFAPRGRSRNPPAVRLRSPKSSPVCSLWTPHEYARDLLIAAWHPRKLKKREIEKVVLWIVASPLSWRVARASVESAVRLLPWSPGTVRNRGDE